MDEVLTPPMSAFDDDESLLATELKLAQNAKKVALMTLGTAAQKYMMKTWRPTGDSDGLSRHHNGHLRDGVGHSAGPQTCCVSGRRGSGALPGHNACVLQRRCGAHRSAAKNTLAGMSEGDELRTLLAALRRFTKLQPMNTIVARQRIANEMIAANKYVY